MTLTTHDLEQIARSLKDGRAVALPSVDFESDEGQALLDAIALHLVQKGELPAHGQVHEAR